MNLENPYCPLCGTQSDESVEAYKSYIDCENCENDEQVTITNEGGDNIFTDFYVWLDKKVHRVEE